MELGQSEPQISSVCLHGLILPNLGQNSLSIFDGPVSQHFATFGGLLREQLAEKIYRTIRRRDWRRRRGFGIIRNERLPRRVCFKLSFTNRNSHHGDETKNSYSKSGHWSRVKISGSAPGWANTRIASKSFKTSVLGREATSETTSSECPTLRMGCCLTASYESTPATRRITAKATRGTQALSQGQRGRDACPLRFSESTACSTRAVKLLERAGS